MTTTERSTFRPAAKADAEALMRLERDTNLVALADVFPDVPYPEDEVQARWGRLIADPDVTVEVVGPKERLDVYLAFDAGTLRHLGVRPVGFYEHLGWSATGRAGAAERPPYPVELEYAR